MIKVDGQKVGENVDCGVFCLYHCASYFGRPFRSYRLNQLIERRCYRAEICASLGLSDLNKIRENVLSSVEDFCTNNEAIMAEVLTNEKLIREVEAEARKAELRADLERRRKAKATKEEAALVAATIAAEEAVVKRKSTRNASNASITAVQEEEAALVAATIAAEETTLRRKSTRNVSAAAAVPSAATPSLAASTLVPAIVSKSKAPAVKSKALLASAVVPTPASKSKAPTSKKKN